MAKHDVGPDDRPQAAPDHVLEQGHHVAQVQADQPDLLDDLRAFGALAEFSRLVAAHVEEFLWLARVDQFVE